MHQVAVEPESQGVVRSKQDADILLVRREDAQLCIAGGLLNLVQKLSQIDAVIVVDDNRQRKPVDPV